MSQATFEAAQARLFAETDGTRFARLKDRFIQRFASEQPAEVLAALQSYVRQGRLAHWRAFLMTDVVRLCAPGDAAQAPFFEWCLAQPELAYWAVDGLLKTAGAQALPALVAVAVDAQRPCEVRAKAVKALALHSGQGFDRDLPSDPGYWRPQDLRLNELIQWQQDGYPQGGGYAAPVTPPALHAPATALERAAAALDQRLAAHRARQQDPAQPSHWLAPAADEHMQPLRARWPLPAAYATFLRQFSPLRVRGLSLPGAAAALDLYGAAELETGQIGYAIDGRSAKPLNTWPAHLLVIATAEGDPYVLDLSAQADGDAPVLRAPHGAGEWAFEKVAESFVDFLRMLASASDA